MFRNGRAVFGPILLAAALGAAVLAAPASAQGPTVRIAYGDVPSMESLNLLVALEQIKGRGIAVELLTVKSEDLATQAVANGQADVGVGTPYAAMQRLRVPLRFFYQLSTLNFYPVVDAGSYKGWKDLDGQDFVVHSRGSGTEALARLMEQKHGIKFRSISYVPGSEVRALAMLRGNIKATIVDAANRRFLMEKAPGRFIVLPMVGARATDDALFARREWLEQNPRTADAIVEELLKVWRAAGKEPAFLAEQRRRYGLLPDLPADVEKDIVPYFTEAAESKVYPADGGVDAARDDFGFYTVSGVLTGDPARLKVDDYWELGPLNRALAKLGRAEAPGR